VCTLTVEEFDDPFQAGDVLIFPQAQILRGDTTFRQHGGCFGKNQSRPAGRAAA